jgi:hypothetical protein
MSCTNGPTASKKLRNSGLRRNPDRCPSSESHSMRTTYWVGSSLQREILLAMLRGLERRGRAPISLLERLRSLRVDAVADVLDDHLCLLT